MKTTIAILLSLILCFSLQAKQLEPGAPTTVTDDGTINSTGAQVKCLVLIFSSDYTGNINGSSASGLAGGTVTFYANQTGDWIGPVTYTTTTGSITYFAVK